MRPIGMPENKIAKCCFIHDEGQRLLKQPVARCPHGYQYAEYGDPYPANCAADGCEMPLLAERADAKRLRFEYARALRRLSPFDQAREIASLEAELRG